MAGTAGTLIDFDLFSVYKVVPIAYDDRHHKIAFLLKPDEHYPKTAGLFFSAEVNYKTHEVTVYMVKDIKKEIAEPFEGDSLLKVKLKEDWPITVERIGSYEHNKEFIMKQQRVLAVAPALNREGKLELGLLRKIKEFIGGGKRSTRKRGSK